MLIYPNLCVYIWSFSDLGFRCDLVGIRVAFVPVYTAAVARRAAFFFVNYGANTPISIYDCKSTATSILLQRPSTLRMNMVENGIQKVVETVCLLASFDFSLNRWREL